MKMPLPLRSTGPSLVMIVPSTLHLGQKRCFILPHGFFGSVPNEVTPLLPAAKGGAACVHFKSTIAFLLVLDLMLYVFPSSLRSIVQPSALKLCLSLENEILFRLSDAQRWSFPDSFAKILLLNCAVVRTPLRPYYQHARNCYRALAFVLQDVAVDDLDHANVAAVADDVEGLGLDIGAVHNLPSDVIFLEFGVRLLFRLLSDGVACFRTAWPLVAGRRFASSGIELARNFGLSDPRFA